MTIQRKTFAKKEQLNLKIMTTLTYIVFNKVTQKQGPFQYPSPLNTSSLTVYLGL